MFYRIILLEILCGASAAIFLEIYELRCSELHGWIIFSIFGVKMKMIQTGSVQRQGGWGWSGTRLYHFVCQMLLVGPAWTSRLLLH